MGSDAYLISYTKKCIYLISLVLAIIAYTIFNIAVYKAKCIFIEMQSINENKNAIEISNQIQPMEFKKTNEDTIYENVWQIEIPKINLIAPISEGTSNEVMQEYVGHFEDTEFIYGNVGLAAHNRGFPINYFARIKELEIGDEIIYKTVYGSKTYNVVRKQIIDDIDWSYLKQDTDKNTITLITCVANRPNKRLCIQGTEVK